MAIRIGLGWAFLALQLLLTFTFTSGEKLVLDVNSDQSKEWFEVSCIYLDDPTDFWVYGCPGEFREGEDSFPERKGYWAPCGAHRCELHYFGGHRTAQAKSISLSMYAKGSPEITVTSKYSVLEEEYTKSVGGMAFHNAHGWYETTLDMSKHSRTRVLKFVLTSPEYDDALFLDKIIIDLGDEESYPTEPPPTIPPTPIDGDVLTLDSDSDYWEIWNPTSCPYVNEYDYMWAFGCPEYSDVTEEGRPTIGSTGFWSSCGKPKCMMQYKASPVVAQPIPTGITVTGFMKGSNRTRIEVALKTNSLDIFCSSCIHLGTIVAPEQGGWVESTLEFEDIRSKDIMLNITLLPEDGGIILIDKIRLQLKSQAPPDGSTGGDDNASNTFRLEWVTLWLSLAMSIFAILGSH